MTGGHSMKDEVKNPGATAHIPAGAAPRHDLKGLTRDIEALRGDLRALADTPHLEELLRLIPRPGWTTPAELDLVRSGVAQLNSQVKLLQVTQDALLRGARLVGRT